MFCFENINQKLVIYIKTETLVYTIRRVRNKLTSHKYYSDHKTHENHFNFYKSEINQ